MERSLEVKSINVTNTIKFLMSSITITMSEIDKDHLIGDINDSDIKIEAVIDATDGYIT